MFEDLVVSGRDVVIVVGDSEAARGELPYKTCSVFDLKSIESGTLDAVIIAPDGH